MTAPTPRARLLWAVLMLTAVLLAAGCASGPGTGSSGGESPTGATTSPTSGAPSTGQTAGVVRISVRVSNGKASPPPHAVEVPRGDRVVLTVTSDREDELHVHGYDIEKPLPAGEPVQVEFVASQPGRFEVETHESETVLLQLLVR